jgi:CRP/FNR family transcriptional regulator, cyclic AMP receptor protein
VEAHRPGGAKLNQATWPQDSLLERLHLRTRQALLGLGTVTTYGAREFVLRQGEESHHVLLVLSGLLKVVADTEFGRPVLLALRGRGDLVGEMSALRGTPRATNVITCRPVRARLVKNSMLREFLDRNPDAWAAVASSLSAHLHEANNRRAEFLACPAPVRVGRVLAEIARRYGERTSAGWDLDVSLTQADLASLAGVALATFEKAVRSMQHHGLLRRRYRRIVVVDLAGLCRFGEFGDLKPIAVRGLGTRCSSE